jgi:hypothetical protein
MWLLADSSDAAVVPPLRYKNSMKVELAVALNFSAGGEGELAVHPTS